MGLSRKLKRLVQVVELHPDRAVLWCRNEGEKKLLLRFTFYRLHNTKPVKIVAWNQREHWQEIMIAGRNRWVGIDGLPPSWWNRHALKVIGNKLGGLVEIADETRDLTFLSFARIKVRGLSDGFIPSYIVLPNGSDSVTLGVFTLNDNLEPLTTRGYRGFSAGGDGRRWWRQSDSEESTDTDVAHTWGQKTVWAIWQTIKVTWILTPPDYRGWAKFQSDNCLRGTC